jgi:PAS domain S-box-containing protein
MALKDNKLRRRKKSVSTVIPQSRGDTNRLVFVNVERDYAFYILAHLSRLHHVEHISSADQFGVALDADPGSIDAVLLGVNVGEPVALAQRIHSVDNHLPIVILSSPSRSATLRQDLMFSPFLGHEVIIWPTSDLDGLAEVLADAAQRRQQRQHYQKATLANAHVQLEVLPLLQPETAEHIEALLDHGPVGVIATTEDGRILSMNRQARRILDVSQDDYLDASLFGLFPADELARLSDLLSRAATSSGHVFPEVFKSLKANEEGGFIEVTAASFPDRLGAPRAMLVLQEVTLRVQAECQRTEAIVELRQIATALRAFHTISTASNESMRSKIRKFLQLGCEQFGLPIGLVSHIEGVNFRILESVAEPAEFKTGNVLQLDRTYCATTIDSTEPIAFENASDTVWRGHSTYKQNRLDAYLGVRIVINGSVYGTLCFLGHAPRNRPFTAAERETLKLMSQWIASELEGERAGAHMRKLSSAIEQTADTVVITDFAGIVEYVNPSFETLMGYSRPEVVGQVASFLRKEQMDRKLLSKLTEAIGNGANFRFLSTDRTKNGQIYREQKTISPLKDASGTTTHLIATGRDVTALEEAKEKDRKRQAELTHVARLSTLGGMVSGLAHELNQPLCAIMTYAQTCLRTIESNPNSVEDIRHGLTQIVRQAERADEIFERVRNFSRKRDLRRQRVDVREIIESVLGFVQVEIEHNQIKLEVGFADKLGLVHADTVQIQQVLLNLVRNSIDAVMPLDESRRQIFIDVAPTGGRYTKIAVSDTGVGCPPNELHRLFEPFFTTKEAGLGVGLSISQGIVEAHGGKLDLVSSSPNGSSFCLSIPNWAKS